MKRYQRKNKRLEDGGASEGTSEEGSLTGTRNEERERGDAGVTGRRGQRAAEP